jgi:hypothetical protein
MSPIFSGGRPEVADEGAPSVGSEFLASWRALARRFGPAMLGGTGVQYGPLQNPH